MEGSEQTTTRPAASRSILRRLLRLVVEADSSRLFSSRMGSIVVLLAALAAFALAGYGAAAWASRLWQ